MLRGYHALVEPAAIGLAVEVLGLHQSHQGRRCVLRRLRQGGRGNAEVVQRSGRMGSRLPAAHAHHRYEAGHRRRSLPTWSEPVRSYAPWRGPAGQFTYSLGMVTSVDLARHLGLSQATVSRALRGHPSVTEKTRQRVVEAAQALGYRPDLAARMLVTRRAKALGIVVADFRSPLYPPAIAAMQERSAARGYRMALIRDPEETQDVDAVDVLNETIVDGLIFMSATDDSPTVARVAARETPMVLLSRGVSGLRADMVMSDDRAGGELVADHLVGLGHRRIALVSVRRTVSNGRDREDGMRDALRARGLDLPEECVRRGSISHASGMEMARSLLAMEPRPTAVFCSTDSFAFAVLDAASQLGIRVPEELSVVGFDDSEPARWSMINLTTVHQPFTEMAAKAVDVLIDRLDDRADSKVSQTVFPVRLVERGTTAAPA
ncbi:LacI family DNA-binding transcriptional regulator [Streptomyces antimycoticus]|uniref:LacI family DNA-binding transcriptional regulator n=1 Tax=Streptomyces antimycoticus TaxID=68175 RepID=UPI0036E90404